MGIAGVYTKWRSPEGPELFSFAMLTVNADGHAVMQHFHKPEDEKRMVVILDEADYDGWLEAPQSRLGDFLKPYPAELLIAQAAPRRWPA